jgi:hypothetical protein
LTPGNGKVIVFVPFSGGKIQSTRIGVFMVWQKQGGSWKLLARQALAFQKVPGAS